MLIFRASILPHAVAVPMAKYVKSLSRLLPGRPRLAPATRSAVPARQLSLHPTASAEFSHEVVQISEGPRGADTYAFSQQLL